MHTDRKAELVKRRVAQIHKILLKAKQQGNTHYSDRAGNMCLIDDELQSNNPALPKGK